MNSDERTARLVDALREHTNIPAEKLAKLLEGPSDTISVHQVRRIRQKILDDTHSYPEGVFGAPCLRCGTREGWSRKCIPPVAVTVERHTLLTLLEIAEVALESPTREVAQRLAEAVQYYTSRDHYCGCNARDADVCSAHRALHDHTELERRLAKPQPPEGT